MLPPSLADRQFIRAYVERTTEKVQKPKGLVEFKRPIWGTEEIRCRWKGMAMSESSIVLLSKDHSLIESMGRLSREIGHLEVSVLSELDQVYNYKNWDNVALVVVHHDRRCTTIGIVRLLRMLAAARRLVATVVLADGLDEDESTELLRMGAADLLPRPFDMGRLSYLTEVLTLRSRQPLVTSDLVQPSRTDRVWRESDPMIVQARRVASQNATVLLHGESGTGKSWLAKVIHDLSPRYEQPFVTIRCSSIAPDGLADELFGRESEDTSRGLGTGRLAEARAGTLLLDDVDTLSARSQAALIRWIEDNAREATGLDRTKSQSAYPRLIATSRAVLADEVSRGRFRSDLFYRLNVIGLELLPLRQRRDEVGSLSDDLLAQVSGSALTLAPEARQAIESNNWPGNIRELREVIESAAAHCTGPLLGREWLPEAIRASSLIYKTTNPIVGGESLPVAQITLAQTKREAEFARITQALEKHGHNRLRTAGELGISRMTLYKKLYKYGIIEQEGRDGLLPSGRIRRISTSPVSSSNESVGNRLGLMPDRSE